jgi:hypothetical protein
MTLRISMDMSTALTRVVGSGSGFARSDLRSQFARFKDIHLDLEAAIEGETLPHVQAWTDSAAHERAQERATVWQRAAERIVVIGTPDAVASVRVLAQLAVPGTGRNQNIRWVSAPDPSVVQAAFHPRDGNWLVLLDGPGWVRRLAEGVRDRAVGATVFVGDGTPEDSWTLDDSDRVVAPGAADPRFGVMGAAALSLMVAAGIGTGAVLPGVVRALAACRRTGLFDNPAYRLGALLHAAFETKDLEDIVCILSTPQLGRWADWMCNSWSAVTSSVVEREGMQRRIGIRPQIVDMANECAMERWVTGPNRHLTFAFWVDDPGRDLKIGESDTSWLMARDLMDRQIAQLVKAGRPVVNVRVPELAPDTVGELCVVFLHAVLALMAGHGKDPLTMSAADAFRRMPGTL